ncbi:protein of unknown function [Rhodovastum atsumiense]|nr:protein of unknown function [Rhodovastum atsumiense]
MPLLRVVENLPIWLFYLTYFALLLMEY